VTRFAADDPSAAHTFVGALHDTITIDGDEGHHLARVRRMRAGERITAADGQGQWRPYRILESRRGALDLRADGDAALEPALSPRLRVAFAVTKATKPDLVVQKLTELGVDRITPLTSRRSVPRWDDDRAGTVSDRLRRVAREAAAQCRRARLPEVDEPQLLATLRGVAGVVVADAGGDAMAAVPEPPAGEWVLVVGPEGGFDADELAELAAPQRLRLAPHVLRAETAAIAGAAVLTARRTPCGGRA
jgi:16S rRNA (uracil1498-N3)-methyltransferase